MNLQDSLKKNTYQFFESMTDKPSEWRERVDGRYNNMNGVVWQEWWLRSDNMFQLKMKKWEEKTLVFIGKVHERRSDALIQDKNQLKNDTCHAS